MEIELGFDKSRLSDIAYSQPMGAGTMPRIDGNDLLSQLSDNRYGALLNGGKTQCRPRRTTLFEEGSKPEFLYVLIEGAIELFAQLDEQETTISVLSPSSAFVLGAVIGDVPYPVSGRTLKDSRILTIPAETVRNTFDEDKSFARAVARKRSRGFCDVLADLKSQKLLTCTARVADWLLRAHAQLGQSGHLTLSSDKRTLASQLGMTPENLSRVLKELSGYGVFVSGRIVILRDPAALAAIARRQSLPHARVTSRPPQRGAPMNGG